MRKAVLLLAVMATSLLLASGVALAATTIICSEQDSWFETGECFGTPEDDIIYGTKFFEDIFALAGSDIVYARGADDFVFGDDITVPPDDPATEQDGDDELYGSSGPDVLIASGGSDLYNGGGDADEIYAYEDSLNEGEDTVVGGGGRDYIEAQDGVKDTINCGKGYDVVYYDEGIDVVSRNCNEQHHEPVPAVEEAASAKTAEADSNQDRTSARRR